MDSRPQCHEMCMRRVRAQAGCMSIPKRPPVLCSSIILAIDVPKVNQCSWILGGPGFHTKGVNHTFRLPLSFPMRNLFEFTLLHCRNCSNTASEESRTHQARPFLPTHVAGLRRSPEISAWLTESFALRLWVVCLKGKLNLGLFLRAVTYCCCQQMAQIASEQIEQPMSRASVHPTRGRRSALHHRLDTSSDETAKDRETGQDSKRLRSTSNTPRSTTPITILEGRRARAPFELDRLMGIGSVGAPSGVDRDSERESSEGGAADQKVPPRINSDHSESSGWRWLGDIPVLV